MKIEIVKECGVAGKSVKKGAKVDCSDKDARYLIATGKAKAVTEPKEKAAK